MDVVEGGHGVCFDSCSGMSQLFDDQVSYVTPPVSSLSFDRSISGLKAYFDSLAEVASGIVWNSTSEKNLAAGESLGKSTRSDCMALPSAKPGTTIQCDCSASPSKAAKLEKSDCSASPPEAAKLGESDCSALSFKLGEVDCSAARSLEDPSSIQDSGSQAARSPNNSSGGHSVSPSKAVDASSHTSETISDSDLDSLIAQFVPRERQIGHIILSGDAANMLPDKDIATDSPQKSVFAGLLAMFSKKPFFASLHRTNKHCAGTAQHQDPTQHQDPAQELNLLQHQDPAQKLNPMQVEESTQAPKQEQNSIQDENPIQEYSTQKPFQKPLRFPSIKRVSSLRHLYISKTNSKPAEPLTPSSTDNADDFSATKAFKDTLNHEQTFPQSNLAFSGFPGLTKKRSSKFFPFGPPPKLGGSQDTACQHELHTSSLLTGSTTEEHGTASKTLLKADLPRHSLGSLFDLYNGTSASPGNELEARIFSPNTHKPSRSDVPSIEERQSSLADTPRVKAWEKVFKRKVFSYGPSAAISPYETGLQSGSDANFPFDNGSGTIPESKSQSTLSRFFGINHKGHLTDTSEESPEVSQTQTAPKLRKSASDGSLQHPIRDTIHKFKSNMSSGRKRSLSLHVRFSSPGSTPTEQKPHLIKVVHPPQNLEGTRAISEPSHLIDVVHSNDPDSDEFFSVE